MNVEGFLGGLTSHSAVCDLCEDLKHKIACIVSTEEICTYVREYHL